MRYLWDVVQHVPAIEVGYGVLRAEEFLNSALRSPKLRHDIFEEDVE